MPLPLATAVELLRHYGSYVGVHGRNSPLANFIYESARAQEETCFLRWLFRKSIVIQNGKMNDSLTIRYLFDPLPVRVFKR